MTAWHAFFACWATLTVGFVIGAAWAGRERVIDYAETQWSDYDC